MTDAAIAATHEQHANVGDPIEHHRIMPRTAHKAADSEPLTCYRTPECPPQPRRTESRGQFRHFFDLDRHAAARRNGFDFGSDVAECLFQFVDIISERMSSDSSHNAGIDIDGTPWDLKLPDGTHQPSYLRAALLHYGDDFRGGGGGVVTQCHRNRSGMAASAAHHHAPACKNPR